MACRPPSPPSGCRPCGSNGRRGGRPAGVEELTPNLLSLSEVPRVLQNLLREQVSIRDMATILETLANFAKLTTSPDVLAEFVRQSLGRAICSQYTDEQGVLHVFTLEPELQDHLLSSLPAGEDGVTLGPAAQHRPRP